MKKKLFAGVGVACMLCVPIFLKIVRNDSGIPVEIDLISHHEIKSSILASGHLLYEEQVHLSPEVIGKVNSIFVTEGKKVTKGDLLLHLDDESYRAEVAQQEAAVRQQRIAIEQQELNLRNQQTQFKRKVELYQMKMISDSAIDDARYTVDHARIELRNNLSRLEQIEAVLKQAKERMAKTKIHAPISGTITALSIKVGETAVASQVGIAGSSLMTISNLSTMITEVNVDEADIAKISPGQDVVIYTAAFPDVAIKGSVLSIPLSPKQNTGPIGQGTALQSRSYSVRVAFVDTKGLTLRPGMTCRTEIYINSSAKSLTLPLQAVLSNNEEHGESTTAKNKASTTKVGFENYVFIKVNGRAEKRLVTLGISDDSQQEILVGVNPGDAVIIGPYRTLRRLKHGDIVSSVLEKKLPTKNV